jgi:hypothetical protein
MHTIRFMVHRYTCFAARLLSAPLLLVPAMLGAAPEAAPKTHVLFIGADISLEKDKAAHPVEDVTHGAVVINSGSKQVNVPMRQDGSFLIRESLKIAETSVTVEDLKYERAYTPFADPITHMKGTVMFAADQTDNTDLMHGEALQAQTGMTGPYTVTNAVRGTQNEHSGVAAVKEAETNQAESQSGIAGVEASRGMFDAIRLTFDIIPDRNIDNPYFAVIAQIREPDSEAGQVRKWAYLKTLGSLHAGVRKKVTVYHGGFPPGYIIENCEVHIYQAGQELATSLSRKRVELTDDEALQFRIIEYVGANKDRTLPAAPAAALPDGVRASLTPAQLSESCFVRVAKDGSVTGVYRDAAGEKPLRDSVLESALKLLRFKPALESGKPVESVVAVVPAQLVAL